jgi:hypothetical protein
MLELFLEPRLGESEVRGDTISFADANHSLHGIDTRISALPAEMPSLTGPKPKDKWIQ